MLLRSVNLRNFRQFKGEQSITFSCDPDRNVTVILGDNTSGKTTLVQAFNWVMYGNANFTTKDLLNIDIARSMHPGDKETVEVVLCLNHDNTEYVISRSQEYACDSRGVRGLPPGPAKVSYRKTDGQTVPIRREVEQTINKILPEQLSNYFFFDGERINTISTKQDVTESVKILLGLTPLASAIHHLNPRLAKSVIGKFRGSMDIGGDQKAEDARKRIDSLSERREFIVQELDNVKEQIAYYEYRKQEAEEILREHESTARLQKKRDDLERSRKQEVAAHESAKKRFIDEFNINAIGFFSRPLMAKALLVLQEADVVDKGIPNMDSASIDYIIKRGRCICGAEIMEGTDEYACLIREKNYLPPQSIGTMIRTFKEQGSIYRSASESYDEIIKSRYDEIRRCKKRIEDHDYELDEISSKFKDSENIRKHEENLRDFKKRLYEFTAKKDDLLREDGSLVSDIQRCQKLVDSYAIVSDKNKEISLYLKYAEAIYDWIKTTYEERESEIRDQLETRVNSIFGRMYHGKRKVIINEKFNVRLLTADDHKGVATDESRGLEAVKNFAFVAGLVDLARERIRKGTADIDATLATEPYPLVMDAPFSNTDEKHVGRISRILPEIAEQVIMVVMAKDWKFAEPVMRHRVGKEYLLDKKSEILTHIKEVI